MEKCPFCGSRMTLGYHNWKYYLATTGDLAIAAVLGLVGVKKSIPATCKNLLKDQDKEELHYCLSCHEVF